MQTKMFYTFIYYILDIGIMLTVLIAQKWKGMVITCTVLCSSGMQLMLIFNILAVPVALDHISKLLL